MFKFTKKILIILLTFLLAQYFIYIFTNKFLTNKSNFRITRYFKNKKHNYFILGNSRGVNSVNESYAKKSLNIDLINLSFNGMPFKNIYSLYQDINSNNYNSTIFIEASSLSNNDIDNSYVYYSSQSPFISKLYPDLKYYILPLLKFNNELFLRNIYYLFKNDDDWVNRNTINKSLINSISISEQNKIVNNYKILTENIKKINIIANKNNNKIIFFLAPYYPKYLSTLTDYNKLCNYFNEYNNNYLFIDLNKVKLSDEQFADRIHTNYNGSYILTKTLIDNNLKFIH
jgi:hypothetical protein